MVNVKLQDQLGDAFASLAEVAGPKGRIHVVVEVVEEARYEALKPHIRTLSLVEDVRLTVRKVSRAPAVSASRAERGEVLPRGRAERLARVVRWTLGGG